jgi:large subunit ribosomal protein L17
LLASLATSLFRHKKITTTLAKAKEARKLAERLISKAKRAAVVESEGGKRGIHLRREVARYIADRGVVKTLFGEIAEKVANRPGGYTRVVKLGQRQGDAAQMAVLELVDYNVAQEKPAAAGKAKEKSGKEKEKSGKEKQKSGKVKEEKVEKEKAAVSEKKENEEAKESGEEARKSE